VVISLNEPAIDDVAVTRQVILQRAGGRNRGFFAAVSDAWIRRVQLYMDIFGNPEHIGPSIVTDENSGKFINLYLSPKIDSAQKVEVLDIIRQHGLDYCPSCGEDGYPRTLDHYLPKEKFPEFSILSSNLVPMCDTCQGEKLSKTVTDDGEKIFLHPYYDRLDNIQVLVAQIIPPFTSGTITRLGINHDLQPVDLRQLCERHFQEIGIDSRYDRYFQQQYLRIKKLFAQARTVANIDLNDVINDVSQFKRMASFKSVNSWDHVFYSSVIKNTPLLQYLASGDLAIVG